MERLGDGCLEDMGRLGGYGKIGKRVFGGMIRKKKSREKGSFRPVGLGTRLSWEVSGSGSGSSSSFWVAHFHEMRW